MKKHVDDDTREIIVSFISEGYERLDDAEAKLESLGTGDDVACLNSIFRLFHSVKGSAGFLGFENIKLLTHEAEALLEVFLKEKAAVSQEALDVIYQTIDALRSMIGLVERDYADEEAAPVATERAAILRDCMATLRAGLRAEAGGAPQGAAGPQAAPAIPSPAPATAVAASSALPNEILLSELVTAEMAERFLSESMDLVDDIEKGGMGLTTRPAPGEAVNELFRAAHTMKGNAGFFGHAFLERLCMELETILDAARRGAAPVNEALANAVIAKVDEFRHAISTVRVLRADGAADGGAAPAPLPSGAPPPGCRGPGPRVAA